MRAIEAAGLDLSVQVLLAGRSRWPACCWSARGRISPLAPVLVLLLTLIKVRWPRPTCVNWEDEGPQRLDRSIDRVGRWVIDRFVSEQDVVVHRSRPPKFEPRPMSFLLFFHIPTSKSSSIQEVAVQANRHAQIASARAAAAILPSLYPDHHNHLSVLYIQTSIMHTHAPRPRAPTAYHPIQQPAPKMPTATDNVAQSSFPAGDRPSTRIPKQIPATSNPSRTNCTAPFAAPTTPLPARRHCPVT